MKVINSAHEMQEISLSHLQAGKTIGLVPTMGALHEGHLSLVQASKSNNDITIASIFVNPTQFGPNEDLDRYPRPFEKDCNQLSNLKVDYIFHPSPEDIYPPGYLTYIEMNGLTDKLCGESRPGHFRGVLTICAKLFLITYPSVAYFGQKDYQQSLIIRNLVRDLNIPVKIKVMPIIRENDGLAMSSRNQYLSDLERKNAVTLYQSICLAENLIQEGERDSQIIKKALENHLTIVPGIKLDYISICHPETLQELDQLSSGNVLVAIALFIGKTRLIDNKLVTIS